MAFWLWLPIALVALLTLALGVRAAGRHAARGVDPTRLTFPPALMAEVSMLARSGRTVAAVKLLRDHAPGLSLVNAKQLVDRLAAKGPAGEPVAARPSVAPELMAEVSALARSGRTVAAVKLLRDHAPGLSLVDAKQLVDGLAVEDQPIELTKSVTQDPDPDRAPSESAVPLEVELQVRGLVSAADPLAALRTLQAATGWDDQRAGRYLDALS